MKTLRDLIICCFAVWATNLCLAETPDTHQQASPPPSANRIVPGDNPADASARSASSTQDSASGPQSNEKQNTEHVVREPLKGAPTSAIGAGTPPPIEHHMKPNDPRSVLRNNRLGSKPPVPGLNQNRLKPALLKHEQQLPGTRGLLNPNRTAIKSAGAPRQSPASKPALAPKTSSAQTAVATRNGASALPPSAGQLTELKITPIHNRSPQPATVGGPIAPASPRNTAMLNGTTIRRRP